MFLGIKSGRTPRAVGSGTHLGFSLFKVLYEKYLTIQSFGVEFPGCGTGVDNPARYLEDRSFFEEVLIVKQGIFRDYAAGGTVRPNAKHLSVRR